MATRSTLRRRPKRPPLAGLLVALGDLALLGVLVGYGMYSHAVDPLEYPGHLVETSIPFVLAWAAVAPLGGLYRRRTLLSGRSALLRTTAVWTVASLLAGAIRASPYFDGGAPAIFLLVNLAFGLAFLLPWRLAAAVALGRTAG